MSRVTLGDFEHQEWTAYSRGYLSMRNWEGSYREGTYRHPEGIVEIYESIGRVKTVSLRFRRDGREYSRRWETNWGDKTIARLARELIEGVVG